MQKVTFSNGKIIYAEIRGGSFGERETLTFTAPGENTTFEELKEILLDGEATEAIIIEYEDAGGSTQINLQTGYVVPVSLSYSVGDTAGEYSMTLGKRTQIESQYEALRNDIADLTVRLEKAAQDVEILAQVQNVDLGTINMAGKII